MATRRSPTEAVLVSLVARLAGSTGVTGIATSGIRTHVPQGTAPPYVVLSVPADSREDTYGRLGSHTVVQTDSVTKGTSVQSGVQLRDQVARSLTSSALSASGHGILGVIYEGGTQFDEIVNGEQYWHHIASWRVWTEQSTS